MSHLTTHLLVKTRHNGIAGIILHIIACAGNGDWRTLRRTNTQHIDTHAGILSGFGSLECPTLVVLAIGNHDDGLADAFFLGKAMCGHIDGAGNIGALGSHHRRVDARQEHLGRHIIAGDRQLHKGIACKHDKSDLIVSEVVYQILDHHLTTLQTAGNNILGQHRVTDIHGDNGLDAHTLLVANLSAQLRAGQHHNQ